MLESRAVGLQASNEWKYHEQYFTVRYGATEKNAEAKV